MLTGSAPHDEATVVAVGYYLLRCGDARLRAWAADLAAAQPDSCDAHLIHASALMRDRVGWRDARAWLLTAAGKGVPLYSAGLRLLDDALRLLAQGTDDSELASARQRYVPYLRASLNRPLTTFSGTDPAAPGPVAAVKRPRRPDHAVRLELQGTTPRLRPVRSRRTTAKRPQSPKMRIDSAEMGTSFGPYTTRVVPIDGAEASSALLELPDEFVTALGVRPVGTVGLTDGQLIIMISNLSDADVDNIQIVVRPAGTSQGPVTLQRRASALMAGLPWRDTPMPQTLELSGVHGRGALDIEPEREPRRREVVHATVARKTALVEEAERLSGIARGREDAAARFGEIAEDWSTLSDTDTKTDSLLWQRFQSARRNFERGNRPGVVIDPQPPRPAEPPPQTPDTGGNAGGPILAVELQLRELLQQANFAGPVWNTVARAAAAYCHSSVVAWLTAGQAPRPSYLGARSFVQVGGPWRHEDAAEVAKEVTVNAVAHFRDRRLATGLWRVEDGVSLATELLDGCAAALPSVVRSAARRGKAGSGATIHRHGEDPVGRSAALLLAARYTPAEVAELLGLSDEAAAEGAAATYRSSAETDRPKGGEPRV